jgi:S1-C subfamily serine protease
MKPSASLLTAGGPAQQPEPAGHRATSRPGHEDQDHQDHQDRPKTGWRGRVRDRRWIGAVLVVLIAVAAVVLWRLPDDGPAPLTQADVARAVQAGIQKAQQEERKAPPDAAAAYQRIAPSLVTITTGDAASSALGAGVVINDRGVVLTALHVVSGSGPIRVRFADGTQATGTITKQEPANDIAVLGVDRLPSVVVPAILGGGAQIGDAVFPVGNPLGLERSLSAGVVSGVDRPVKAENKRTLTGLIQFDAAVNPGNSGGPLLDRNGTVIGIVTSLANPAGQPYFVGIGFAVPIDTAGGVAGGPQR